MIDEGINKYRNYILFVYILIVLFNCKLGATTFYVSLSGNDSWSGTSPDSAWRHIAYATQQVHAGDTAVIKSGNYGNEQAEIANSGTLDSLIVIRAEIPGEVIMQGEGSGNGILIEDDSHIIIEGIKFTNYSAGVFVYHIGSYITVRKCAFIENNSGGFLTWGTSSDISLCHHIVATENQFSDYTNKQDYGIYFCYATNCVANNNYFFGQHHQALSFKRKVYYGIAKNNIFEGFLYSAIYLGQNLSASGDDNRSYNLIAEGNTFCPAEGYRAKTPIWVANVERAVVRNNFMEGKEGIDGGWGQGIGLGDYESGYYPANPTHITIHNNVIRKMSGTTNNPGIRLYGECHDVRVFNNTFTQCARNLGFEYEDTILFKNNIFYDYESMLYEGTAQYAIFEYNDIYPYWSGSGSTDISVKPHFVGPFDSLELSVEDPYFIPDYSRAEVCKLQENSPCIDSGSYLTYTVGSGSGGEIEVEDAGYFTDGYGITDGDMIRVGANSAVRITDIDYDNSTVTVDQSISWNNGDGVSLPYSNSVPDIGAYEYDIGGIVNNNIIIYPNPCNVYMGHNSITFNNLSSNDIIRIYNISGKLVCKSGDLTSNTYKWSVNNISSGIYFYKVKGNNKASGKIVIIR